MISGYVLGCTNSVWIASFLLSAIQDSSQYATQPCVCGPKRCPILCTYQFTCSRSSPFFLHRHIMLSMMHKEMLRQYFVNIHPPKFVIVCNQQYHSLFLCNAHHSNSCFLLYHILTIHSAADTLWQCSVYRSREPNVARYQVHFLTDSCTYPYVFNH